MGGSASNIQQILRDSVPDEGIWRDIKGVSLGQLREENGNIVTTATTPVLVLATDFLNVKWVAGNADATYLIWQAGRELANRPERITKVSYPRFRLLLSARMDGVVGPDTPALTVTARARAFNGALKAEFASVYVPRAAEANVITSQTNPLSYTYSFNNQAAAGLVVEPGDQVVFKIVPAAHANDALEFWGLRLMAAENEGFTDINSRR